MATAERSSSPRSSKANDGGGSMNDAEASHGKSEAEGTRLRFWGGVRSGEVVVGVLVRDDAGDALGKGCMVPSIATTLSVHEDDASEATGCAVRAGRKLYAGAPEAVASTTRL